MNQRIRIFAGPNGSGKTTLVNQWIKDEKPQLINPNRHINPDALNSVKVLNFDDFGLNVDEADFKDFVLNYHFYDKLEVDENNIIIENNCFNIIKNSSYMGAMLSDYLRECFLKSNERLFSFETVLSHPSKIDYIKKATQCGWMVYLYFVSTSGPQSNCERIESRVLDGGHDVPPEKTHKRYWESHENLLNALEFCKRAYIFDNSGDDMWLFAEKCKDGTIKLTTDGPVPKWFDDCVLSKL
ncbi:MAG: hypothetical protein PWQ51_2109 [Methanolobus sp.]|jgi:predicted ABC-type ATPase|uniref:hypothetical protein n=1 Tax=unclassified Methanolobus TaxID=2629569 RepID=UPI0024AB2EE4|nr:hypothetical protein [Methanolobus sp.]MDI3486059.1 hypothetical protein [Methanolobus sp.]MDK2831142.1 hypothetical protein [Methanolobus sp.]MDK2939944.1 hypothetical protein [Methanolobus sp.]